MSLSVRQTRHRLLCELLRGVLVDAVECGPEVVGSVQSRAVAALYGLVTGHPVDRRGRCRSCRRPGAVFGWQRRRCRVHTETAFWLHHPDQGFLLSQLAREFGQAESSRSDLGMVPILGGGEDGTERLPRIAADPEYPSAAPHAPAVSPPPALPGGLPSAGQPVLDHGAVGERPQRPRPRRGPSDDHRSVVLAEGGVCLV